MRQIQWRPLTVHVRDCFSFMRARSPRVLCFLMGALVLADSTAAAQRQNPPVVTGVVLDPTGAVLQNARVELRTTAGAPVESTNTDAIGAFQFERVRPGRYDLFVAFEGFRPATVRVAVGSRALAPLRVTLPLAAISQEVTVDTAPAEVHPNAASNLDASTTDQKTLDNLPVFNQDVLATMSRFLDSTAIGTNGVTLVVNGVEVNSLMVSASAVQQIKINQDPYSVEFSRPGRGRIEIVTKAGSLEYHGTANVLFRDSTFDARNAFAAVRPLEQRRIFEGFLGGPVRGSDKTSFTLSLKDEAEDSQTIVFATDLAGPVRQNVASPYRNVLASGTVTHQRGQNTTLSLTASYQDQTAHNQGVGGVTLPSAGTSWNFIEQLAIYNQQTVIGPRLLHQLRVLVGQEFESGISVGPDPKIVVLDAFVGGGAQANQLRTEHHVILADMLTWSPSTHVIKVGVNVPDWSRRRYDDNTNAAGTFYFSSLADYAERRPYSFIQQVGNGHVAFLEKVIGLFVQDEIRVRPNLSVTFGVRYDWQNYFHDTNNVAPRGSFAFAPGRDGRTVVRGGAGLFYDRTGPRPIQDFLRYDGVRQLRYVITDPGYPDAVRPGQNLGEPPSTVQLAPDINIPSTLQYSVSLERQLAKSTSASMTYTGTRGFDVFRWRDVNAPMPPFYAVRPDATHGVVRQIESAGRSVANAVQFTVRGQMSRFFNVAIQYTLSRANNDTTGVNWTPPNAYDLSLEYARADADQRQRFDLLGTLNPGKLFNLGVSVALYSGRPYSITTGHDDFNTGTANARPAGVLRNSAQGPGYADIDLRWSRDVFLGGTRKSQGPAMTIGVDAFNVFNRVNSSSYVGALTSPFFGRAVSAQMPRRLQASLRARF